MIRKLFQNSPGYMSNETISTDSDLLAPCPNQLRRSISFIPYHRSLSRSTSALEIIIPSSRPRIVLTTSVQLLCGSFGSPEQTSVYASIFVFGRDASRAPWTVSVRAISSPLSVPISSCFSSFYDRHDLGMFHCGTACKHALFREPQSCSPLELKAPLDDKVRPSRFS